MIQPTHQIIQFHSNLYRIMSLHHHQVPKQCVRPLLAYKGAVPATNQKRNLSFLWRAVSPWEWSNSKVPCQKCKENPTEKIIKCRGLCDWLDITWTLTKQTGILSSYNKHHKTILTLSLVSKLPVLLREKQSPMEYVRHNQKELCSSNMHLLYPGHFTMLVDKATQTPRDKYNSSSCQVSG